MRKIVLGALLFLFTLSASGQNAKAKLTWIRHFTVERGREADFMQYVRDFTKPMMERLAAEKKIVAWGVGFPVTMTDEPFTHIIYVGLPDWSGAEAIGSAIEAQEKNASPADMQRMLKLESSIREGSVRDVILRHIVQSDTAPMVEPKYVVADTYTIKPGRGNDAVALFNEWAKPMFTSDAVRAKVPMWGLSTQAIPTEEHWTHMVWYFVSDLGALDTIDAAGMSVDARKMQGYEVRLRDMSDVAKQRSQIIRVMTP
ncbi:MAG TPA: hypothetical protein VND45_05625 [Thermoanaerobaculia bacterium]|jgi:hypothetical protein|nr:hypothetical protein [Thermoanaerobaculia bacterium]